MISIEEIIKEAAKEKDKSEKQFLNAHASEIYPDSLQLTVSEVGKKIKISEKDKKYFKEIFLEIMSPLCKFVCFIEDIRKKLPAGYILELELKGQGKNSRIEKRQYNLISYHSFNKIWAYGDGIELDNYGLFEITNHPSLDEKDISKIKEISEKIKNDGINIEYFFNEIKDAFDSVMGAQEET